MRQLRRKYCTYVLMYVHICVQAFNCNPLVNPLKISEIVLMFNPNIEEYLKKLNLSLNEYFLLKIIN